MNQHGSSKASMKIVRWARGRTSHNGRGRRVVWLSLNTDKETLPEITAQSQKAGGESFGN